MLPVSIPIEDTCEVGDPIGYDNITNTRWQRADADGKFPAQFIAAEACDESYATSSKETICYRMAIIDFGSGSTATPGDMVYLSNTVGQYAATPGSWVNQCVGQCVSATKALIQPSCLPLMAYSTTGTGYGAHIRAEIASGKTSVNPLCGLRVGLKTIATSVIGGDVYVIYVMYQMQQTQTATSAIMRLCDESDAADVPDAFMMLSCTVGGGPDYFLSFMNATATSWGHNASCSTGAGWLKVYIEYAGGITRYINLYSDTPS